ncbi:MAG: DUF72 domain-containing protein [Bryobacteraceae bacterium]
MSSQWLFPPEAPAFRVDLAAKVAKLAARGVFFGTSSWKYEGWLDQIYTRERYLTRGRFSKNLFEQTCLEEYAEVFPVVCGDFSFYQFPTAEFWNKLFLSAPSKLHFAFKVPEEITVRIWPNHPRYGPKAGVDNPAFLNADAFGILFLEMLEPFRDRVDALIFEFGSFPHSAYPDAESFVADLDPFLAALPPGWRYSVEIRNPEFLTPVYFDCLRRHGVAHVFNAWSRMPELGTQIAIPGVETADFFLTRALLRKGRQYEQAVKQFQPYEQVQDPNPAARDALRSLARKAIAERKKAFIYVNNRLEGNAPSTIDAVLEGLE